jgi:hypothetical protein
MIEILIWGCAIGLCCWFTYINHGKPEWLKPSTYILRKKWFADGSVRYSIDYGLSQDEVLRGCDNDDSAKIMYNDFCSRHQKLADSMKVKKEEILK